MGEKLRKEGRCFFGLGCFLGFFGEIWDWNRYFMVKYKSIDLVEGIEVVLGNLERVCLLDFMFFVRFKIYIFIFDCNCEVYYIDE